MKSAAPPLNEPGISESRGSHGKVPERGSRKRRPKKRGDSVGDGDEPEYNQNITNSSTARLFPVRRSPDIDISADRTGERARSVQVRILPALRCSARDHDPIRLNRIMISSLCVSMILSENRFALFRITPGWRPCQENHQPRRCRGRLFPCGAGHSGNLPASRHLHVDGPQQLCPGLPPQEF